MRRFTIGFGLLAIVAIAACGDDNGTGVTEELFQAALSGDEEVPAVETDAEGIAEFLTDGTTVLYGILATEDLTDVRAAHIHLGESGENGGILVTLYSGPTVDVPADSLLVQDGFTAVDEDVDLTITELLDLMRSSGVYVNVHTEENPGGEIRGQVIGPLQP